MIEATIKQAKRMLKECVKIYLEKNEAGEYFFPQNKQRPIHLEGPAGIGKTELVKQVAEEEGIGFVAYSMTHHNRQSAIGLPAIVDKTLDGESYKATEYTMSEIVESIWNAKREGMQEGILFADEVNCVSETLTAAMLQFLQNKTFGPHRIPEGWIIVTAGNPPEYNKSVREFDAVTRDRLRIVHMKPDLNDWIEYAVHRGMHPVVVQYVRSHAGEFYSFALKGKDSEIVTARGWEDLSNTLKAYERRGFAVDEALVGSFIQNEKTAISFIGFYRTMNNLISVEELSQILNGKADVKLQKKLQDFDFQKRWAVMICLYNVLQSEVESILAKIKAQDIRYEKLKEAAPSKYEKQEFQNATEQLEQQLDTVKAKIDYALLFLKDALAGGKEAEIMIGMMLENENFQMLLQYRKLDMLIALYEEIHGRMNETQKEIRAWAGKE